MAQLFRPITSGPESFDLALKQIFDHPNLAPFVSKQLIQRFVTSNPSPAYIGRVASAFEIGRYVLPNGNRVGTGRRGDLRATIAAVLTDAQALQDPASKPADFGKVREPLIRVINWARAFNETTPDTANEYYLSDRNTALRQTAFRAPSVFNFFRPGYIAAGMATGDAGLVAPELQIVNESSAIEYVNFINRFIYDTSPTYDDDDEAGVNADYTAQLAIADNAQALMDNLDLLLTGNELNSEAKTKMVALLETMAVNTGTDTEDDDRLSRVHVAISMVMDFARIFSAKIGKIMTNRRDFLKGSASTGALSFLGGASLLSALGQNANAAQVSGYKALVCLFFLGGQDGHDTVLPYDQTSYDAFAAARPGLLAEYAAQVGGSTRTRDKLLALSPSNSADFFRTGICPAARPIPA